MSFDHFGHQRDALFRRCVRQANQPRMGDVVQIDQLPEVGIDGNQDSLLGRRALEQCTVSRIRAEMSSFQNIVPGGAQPFRQTAASASVN